MLIARTRIAFSVGGLPFELTGVGPGGNDARDHHVINYIIEKRKIYVQSI